MKVLLALLTGTVLTSLACAQASRNLPANSGLTISVADENGQAIQEAKIQLIPPGGKLGRDAVTDPQGRVRFQELNTGTYRLEVRKVGFYELRRDLQFNGFANLQAVLHHVEEFHETVEVSDSPPEIDPAKTESSETLTNREIFSLPYPSTRDFRNVLPFLPSVVQEPNGEVHIAGGASSENFEQLDGFNITQPVTGALAFRISPDAIRTINILTSRYSAENGKGSGGVLRLEGKMGDDHFRFGATNFLPGVELRQGFTPSNLSPRVTFSGPLRRGKAWWLEGVGAEYDFNINKDLPFHPQSSPVWRINSLTRAQVNLSSANVLTADLLVNQEKAARVGLGLQTPVASTTSQSQFAYFAGVKDSIAISDRSLLNLGIGLVTFTHDSLPKGSLPYLLAPQGVRGSYFERLHLRSQRWQWLAHFVRTTADHKHELTFGSDLDAITFHEAFQRNPIFILRQDGTLLRETTFTTPGAFTRHNSEVSLYAQDRWSVTKRFLAEYGVRSDWDSIIHQWNLQPRVAGTYMLGGGTKTKLSAGIGLVTDATNLSLLIQPLQGERVDQDFAPDGSTPVGAPKQTSFISDPRTLRSPRSLNWSVGFEEMMPNEIYLKAEFQQKRGDDGSTFINIDPNVTSSGTYLLWSAEKKKYDAFTVTAQRKFANNHEIFISYVRSAARSNAVIPFTLASPLFGQQAPGPLPWDVPDHIVSWGWLPLSSRFDIAYSLDWHTGFPFLVVNQEQQILLPADRARFPEFFTVNLHVERRFHFHDHEWAVRLGVNNVTGRRNPSSVDNNIDSPTFLMFSNNQHRAVAARIRLVGRK